MSLVLVFASFHFLFFAPFFLPSSPPSQLGRSAGRASRQDLEDFLQTYDLEEAIGGFIGKVGGVDIDMNKVTLIDVSQFQAQASENIKPVYRDYPDD